MSFTKITAGKKKIEMGKIVLPCTLHSENETIFKMASELSTVFGAQTIVLLFSPSDKPYSFAHPRIGAVANRFLSNNNALESNQAPTLYDAYQCGYTGISSTPCKS
ncbi:hypothetical protein FRX31_029766 [Thalictrum thalictroides]|uniref:MADS-box domain-containing protein n=1 Tax=Thalictrum thalictroides TaxID=46969 RepID=A0A7J6V6D2_THATH|nr:hypothetical protein FRX31_029766 [Thalictrum thalictroides]